MTRHTEAIYAPLHAFVLYMAQGWRFTESCLYGGLLVAAPMPGSHGDHSVFMLRDV